MIKDYIESLQEKKPQKILQRELKIKTIKREATTIIGPRRAGKTFYFFKIIQSLRRNEVLYLDFEELFLRDLQAKNLLRIVLEIFPEIVGNEPKYIFLDETQNLNDWQNLVRTLTSRDYSVFITGASSKLLSKEIATQLRGRTISYLLLPFSFKEFLDAKKRRYNLNLLSHIGKIKKDLKTYLEYGGFPEIVLNHEKDRVLKEYLDLVFFKDFIERHNIKSIGLAKNIFTHILQNFSKEFSVRAIEKKLRGQGLRFDVMTLYKYVEALDDTLFFFFVNKFSPKVHLRESWPKKVYICDMGISRKIRHSENSGKLMENTVFLELMRKTNEKPLLEIYYWRDYQQREVDFVIKERLNIKQLIQVTYASGIDEVEKRELRALIKASDLLKCNDLLCITWDYENEEEFKGKKIRFVPLWKWIT